MSYLSKGSDAQAQQLKVQELVVGFADTQLYTASGSTITVDCGQTVSAVKNCLFIDDSAGTVAPVVAASVSISDSDVTLTLSAAFAANDSVRLCFVV